MCGRQFYNLNSKRPLQERADMGKAPRPPRPTEKIIQVLSGSCILVVFQIPKELSSRCCALLGCCPSPLKPILAYVVSGARLRQRLYCRYMKEVTSHSDLSFLDAIFLTRPIGQGCEDSLKHGRRRATLPSSSGTQGCKERSEAQVAR